MNFHVRFLSLGAVSFCMAWSAGVWAKVSVSVQVPLPSVHIEIAPPAPRHEAVPPPRQGHLWRSGYWRWKGHRHVWEPGVWIAIQPGSSWRRDRWERERSGWRFVPGHWEPRGREERQGKLVRERYHSNRRPVRKDENWARPSRQSFQIPPDRVPPRGTCKVWFRDLPPDRQSPPMSCRKARTDAREWGGMVIWARGSDSYQNGQVSAEDFGPHRLHNVPPDRLPPPGMCRLWYDNAPPDRQSRPESCRSALHRARRHGGRVLYMPGSDM